MQPAVNDGSNQSEEGIFLIEQSQADHWEEHTAALF